MTIGFIVASCIAAVSSLAAVASGLVAWACWRRLKDDAGLSPASRR